jgi:hypothetical protein
MKIKSFIPATLITIASLSTTFTTVFSTALPARADSMAANCSYIPNGADKPEAEMPCRFYQSQGHIVLTWDDGVKSDFMPVKGVAMTYRDQNGGMVYRDTTQDEVDIFKMENGTIYVTPARSR